MKGLASAFARYFVGAIWILVAACNGTAGLSRASQEDQIREAVFRYQFQHNQSGIQDQARVYCLTSGSWNEDDDPSDEFMTRFQGHVPPVKKGSQCSFDYERRGQGPGNR